MIYSVVVYLLVCLTYVAHTIKLDIHIINLERRPERLANCTRQLSALKQTFTRFPAVDGTRLRMLGHSKFVKFSFHPGTKANLQECFNYAKKHNYWGAFGCWQSHLQLYFKLKESGKKGPFFILEDDVAMEADTFSYIQRVLPTLPSDWDMFLVGWGGATLHQMRPNREFQRVKKCYCLHAYIVKDVSVLEKLIRGSNRPSVILADYVLAEGCQRGILNCYISWPREYVYQDRKSFPTDIPTSLGYPLQTVKKPIKTG